MTEGNGRLAENILYFARALRTAGVPVGPGAVLIELAQVPKERDQLDLWENVKRGVLKVRDVRDEGRILKSISRPKPTMDDTLRRFLGMGDRVLRELRTSPEAAMADRKVRARLQALHKALGEVLEEPAKDAP